MTRRFVIHQKIYDELAYRTSNISFLEEKGETSETKLFRLQKKHIVGKTFDQRMEETHFPRFHFMSKTRVTFKKKKRLFLEVKPKILARHE